MAGSVNKVILIGNLGADPEVRSFQNGGKVCNLRVATSETWKDKNTGERQERTQWHQVAIFNGQDDSGQDRYSTEVVLRNFSGSLTMLDKRGDNDGGGSRSRYGDGDYNAPSGDVSGSSQIADFDDEIPF